MITILQAASGGSTFIFLGLMLAAMFFFMIWPQMQRQKKEKKFQDAIQKGDKVVMTSGIHGKIFEINDTFVIIETMAGKLKFEKAAISVELTKARYGKEEVKK